MQQNGLAIEPLSDAQRTPAVCLAAVCQDGRAIERLSDAQRSRMEAYKRELAQIELELEDIVI